MWQVGDGRVHALTVEKNFVVTSHGGCVVKCWRNDFSDVTMTIKCESEVMGFEADGRGHILCAQQDRSLSIIDIKAKSNNYLLRSHREGIIDFAFHRQLGRIVSASEDQTIRVWKLIGSVME